jgi:hypothetical protein
MLGGLSQLAPAASISGVLNLNPGASNPGQASFSGTEQNFGTIIDPGSGLGNPPYNGGVVSLIPEASVLLDGSARAHVRTDARRVGPIDPPDPAASKDNRFYLTTYAYFTGTPFSAASEYRITNSAYWEINVFGNYGWSIMDQIPQFTGAKRTFRFEKVVGGVPTLLLASDNVGNGGTNPNGTLGTGTYRLFYTHTNSDYTGTLVNAGQNPEGSTNLDILFTFQSEDSSGAVPEPTSVAVFGLLGIGGAVAKWRRKK